MTNSTAVFPGWTGAPFTGGGFTYDVYRKGSGPGVVLIPEMPGLHPGVWELGNHLAGAGFTVAAPSLFGTPGAGIGPGAALVLARACVAKEFAAFATNKKRPITDFIRALARDLNAQTPGRGVGVIGMCFTGGFALAAAVDDAVLAPVLSQPSLPIGVSPASRRDPGVSEDELAVVQRRAENDGLCALGLRFSEDQMAPRERFRTLKDRLGDAFEVIEINSAPGNPDGLNRFAHSVLTDQVVYKPDHPTFQARERVVEFLTERLT